MGKLSALHIDIAEKLIGCAKKRETICYEKLCEQVNYPSPHAVGRELGVLSEFTYEKYGIFISVLVVLKETQNSNNPIPSSGFFTMYDAICGKPSISMDKVVELQREKVFNQDWSDLPDLIRKEIKVSKN